MKRKLSTILAACVLLAAAPAGAAAPAALFERAEEIAREITILRSSLAASFVGGGSDADIETFRGVCGQVVRRIKGISAREGVTIRHSAVRYRNPANAATPDEKALIERFDSDRTLLSITEMREKEGKKTIAFHMPVFVERSCLACHGPAALRPRFVKERYGDDRAYGFVPGDIRGMISVIFTIP